MTLSLRAIHFGVDYNIKPVSENLEFVGIKNIDMIKKSNYCILDWTAILGKGNSNRVCKNDNKLCFSRDQEWKILLLMYFKKMQLPSGSWKRKV